MIPNRIKRINTLLQEEISVIMQREIKDPRVGGFATVTDVVTAPDLYRARVYVSVLSQDEEQRRLAVLGLNSAADFIRVRLKDKIELRRIPALRFFLDTSIERGVRISRLIDQVCAENPVADDNDDDKKK